MVIIPSFRAISVHALFADLVEEGRRRRVCALSGVSRRLLGVPSVVEGPVCCEAEIVYVRRLRLRSTQRERREVKNVQHHS